MSKRKRQHTPETQRSTVTTVQLADLGTWLNCVTTGYTPLYENPEVRMCVHQYADLVSNMTIRLMENTAHGDNRVKNSLSRKVEFEPSEYMNRKQLIYWIVSTMFTSGNGNAVVYPEYTYDGQLQNLIPLDPTSISFTGDGEGYVINYGSVVFKPDEVLHFAMQPDPHKPWLGRGWNMSLRQIVDSIVQADKTKDTLMQSPAPSLIVKVDGLAEDFASKDGRKKLANKYILSRDSGEPWIIPAELADVIQVKPLTMQDLAIQANLELDRTKIARLMNVPKFTVGVGEFNEAEYNYFVSQPVRGIALIIEQELTRKLLYKPEWHWQLNARSLYNYKLPELIDAGRELVDRAAMTRNEWRDWIGLSPDESMNDIVMLENYLPIDRLGDQKKLNGANDE